MYLNINLFRKSPKRKTSLSKLSPHGQIHHFIFPPLIFWANRLVCVCVTSRVEVRFQKEREEGGIKERGAENFVGNCFVGGIAFQDAGSVRATKREKKLGLAFLRAHLHYWTYVTEGS